MILEDFSKPSDSMIGGIYKYQTVSVPLQKTTQPLACGCSLPYDCEKPVMFYLVCNEISSFSSEVIGQVSIFAIFHNDH